MAHRIAIPATAFFLALAVAGCSPSERFAQLALPLIPDNTGIETAQADAETPQDLAIAEAEAEAGTESDVLSYAPATRKPDNPSRAALDPLIAKYAAQYNVPLSLVHHVVNRESTYNPAARNGKHWGLMQLNPTTARTMGYRGVPSGLLDAETNLKYGVKYLAGAYMVADGDAARADRLYQSGYYYHAKRKGLLKATGLRP